MELFLYAEEIVKVSVLWLRLMVESIGALIVALGVIAVLWACIKALLSRQKINSNGIRLTFARYLAMALEFQLGADILSTAIAPSWDEIRQLAVIAVIRTGLNYFLMKEMSQEHEQSKEPTTTAPPEPTPR